MRKKIDELYRIITDAQIELCNLKGQCPHDKGYFISLYGDLRASIPQRLCNVCDSPVGDPSKEEWEEFERKEKEETEKNLKENGFSEDEISELIPNDL